MKTIKFLLVAMLLTVCGSEASAQNVVVYKKDGTKVEYQASQVKSVKYSKAYYYYVGSSDDCTFNGATIPTGLNFDYDKYVKTTTMPVWDNVLGNTIKTDALVDNYTWVIMPSEWFNKLVITTVLQSVVTFDPERVWVFNMNDVEYTAAWADITAAGLYFNLK